MTSTPLPPRLLRPLKDEDRQAAIERAIEQLAAYPHVQRKLQVGFGSEQGRQDLIGFLIDKRPGRHHSQVRGFDPASFKLLLRLSEVHDELFPEYVPQPRLQPAERDELTRF